MRLRFTRRALVQVREIRAYVASESPSVAEAIVRRIETVAALVARHPAIGRPTTIKG
ncbi:MAG: type II toxin-antitoxin system RelE/ParE family toxin, partial [Bauldia sp.]|nr:type II toxin-antitoxin system RelE/ParE family toxin [Bauldia sp.]